MNRFESNRKMHGLTISALVLDGIAAAGFIAMMAFDNGHMAPLGGIVAATLLFGFFYTLSSILIAESESTRVMIHATGLPERRRSSDRRVIDLGPPDGIERRTGYDRRVTELALGAILAPRADGSAYRIRP